MLFGLGLSRSIERRLRLGLRGHSTRYGLRRDLTMALQRPQAKFPISVRPLADSDLASLLQVGDESEDSERQEVADRRAFARKGIGKGFVAVDLNTDTPCYVQWLIGASENAGPAFPDRNSDAALLENAYTPPCYRGKGVMSAAMALIAERAVELQARYVLTFVHEDNIASLKGCQRAGFYTHMLHHYSHAAFGLYQRNAFETLDEADARRSLRF
jgi:GNAT superfamily N-acetyltransferase